MREGWWASVALASLGVLVGARAHGALPQPAAEVAVPAAALPEEQLEEVTVTALEPRYVAPTLRDRLGRIWAPVYLNGKGPFKLVLDTGASHSAVIAGVATDLGLPMTGAMMLHGVTGSATSVPLRDESTPSWWATCGSSFDAAAHRSGRAGRRGWGAGHGGA